MRATLNSASALLDRRAEALAQIALDHHAVEGRLDRRLLQAVADQVQPGLGLLGHAWAMRISASAVGGAGLLRFALVTVQVGQRRGLFQLQFARLEGQQRAPGRHGVARADKHLVDVTVERRRQVGHLVAAQDEVAFHPVTDTG